MRIVFRFHARSLCLCPFGVLYSVQCVTIGRGFQFRFHVRFCLGAVGVHMLYSFCIVTAYGGGTRMDRCCLRRHRCRCRRRRRRCRTRCLCHCRCRWPQQLLLPPRRLPSLPERLPSLRRRRLSQRRPSFAPRSPAPPTLPRRIHPPLVERRRQGAHRRLHAELAKELHGARVDEVRPRVALGLARLLCPLREHAGDAIG